MATDHTNLIKTTLLYLSKNNCRAWQNDTGCAKSMDGSRTISFGLKGSSDIIGIHHTGKFIACEIKIGKDKLRPEQEAFKNMILKMNGYYFIIKDEEDVLKMIGSL
jgi:hypothetical protein